MRGIASTDVLLRRGDIDGNNLRMIHWANGILEEITIEGYFVRDGISGQVIDRITFDDGVSWDFDAVNTLTRQVTESQDNIFTDADGETVHGQGGDDNLHGMEGDDQLYGDAGNDFLEGDDGNDTLAGGEGNDRLCGDDGSDLYLFNIGDGHDRIYDRESYTTDDINLIRLGEGK